MRTWTMLGVLLLLGCDGPRTCDESPQAIFCDFKPGQRFIGDVRYVNELWSPTVTDEWGCALEADGGTLTFIPQGELCTTKPAADQSLTKRMIGRRCAVPEGNWLVVGPRNSLELLVLEDGGLTCSPR